MKKQTSPGWGILGLLCTLFFCLSIFPVVGQTVRSEECPPLEDQDINMEFVLPSSNCESPGLIYLNLNPLNKGIDRIHYRIFTPSWQKEVDLADPMGKVLFTVPKAEYAKEMRLRVTYTCGSNTRTKEMILFNDPDDLYNKLEPAPIEYVSASISSVSPGNGLDATGSISSRLEYVSGIQEATFRLYKKSDPETILASVHSTTPYAGVTFDNLQAGEYFVKVEAKPICQPNPLPENWENGHLVIYSDTEVLKPFKLIVTPLESVGSCPGGLKVEVSGVKRVQTIEYAVFEDYTHKNLLQTFIATYPNFTHTFRGLEENKFYYVTATEKTGNGVETALSSLSWYLPKVEIETVHGTYVGKAEGAVRIMMNGITEDCPVKYTITRKKGEGSFTPIVKDHVTETATLIEGLPAGLYRLEAQFGDGTSERSFWIDKGSIGELDHEVKEQPKLCEPTAKISWTIREGLNYHPRKVRLTNRETGSLVREFTLPVGVSTFETNNLFGGAYKLTLIDETAGVETSSEFTIGTKKDLGIEGDVSVAGYGSDITVDFCREKAMVRIPFRYWGGGGIEQAPHLSQYLERAIYEIYRPDGKTLVYSGMVPKLTGNEVSYIETPEIGKDYKLYIKSACGYPVDTFGLYLPNYQLNTNLSFRGCDRKGRDVVMSVVDPESHAVPNITFKVKNRTTGAVVAEQALGAGEETFTIQALSPGDYVVEWFPQCAPTQLHTEQLNVPNTPQVQEISSYSALCKYNDGGIRVSYYDLEIAGGWRHELYRKSDHKLLKAYEDNSVSPTFDKLQAGEYIVKTAPVVGCDEMLPIETEVTVGSREPERSTIDFVKTETATAPYKKEGVAHYQSVFNHLSWEVYDLSTGDLLNKGTTESNKEYAPYEIKIDKLPQYYKIVFDTPCGKVERIDHLETTESPVGFDLITTDAHKTSTCSDFGIITVKSRLKAAGLPEKGTKIMLYNYDVPIDSVKNATSIIESHSFVLKDPGHAYTNYRVAYFYDGTMVEERAEIRESSSFSPEVQVSPFSLKGAATLSVRATSAEPGTRMRVEVKAGNDETVLADEVVPADQLYRLKVARANSPFSTRVTMMGGCYDGQSAAKTVNGSPATFSFELNTNTMRCRNDGVITPVVPEAFHDVDQIHFTLTKVEDSGSSSYTTVSETSTPAVPKPFIGLEAGTYRVAGRATVFHDEHNQPVVQDFETTTTLYFSGGEGLYAQARPDYGLPSYKQCPGGSIGLEIENGSGKYRVFLKSTPEGPLETPQEIFPTSKDDNRRWGKNMAAGHYSLSVTDGCMERDIPDAEIPEIANEANVSASSTMRPFGRPDLPLDSLAYTIIFDPSAFPELARPSAYQKYEVQLVHKGEQPDEQKWMSNWVNEGTYNTKISGKINKSENCEYEVLFRPKECPALQKRLPFNGKLISPFEGKWVQRGCDSVQWVFTSGEVGRPYNILVWGGYPPYYKQGVVFQTPAEYLRPNPQLVFPARESMQVWVHTDDGCPTTYQSYSSPVVDRHLDVQLDDDHIFSDCDGRRLAIRGWRNSCQQPMKYYAYEVNEHWEETLVAQSDGYLKLGETWNSDYKFKKGSHYVIRILEKGKSEQEDLIRFNLQYNFPSAYKLNNYFSRWSFIKGRYNNYDFYKKAYILGGMSVQCSWEDGVPDNRYLTIPKPLKFVATQKQAPHRKFVATQITRYEANLHCTNWKEELPDGTLSEEAYAPEGEYSFELETVCGNYALGDDYIGSATIDLSPTTIEPECDGKYIVTPKGTVTYRGRTDLLEFTSYYISGDGTPSRNWGESVGTYQHDFDLYVDIRRKSDGKTFTASWPFSMKKYTLDFDQSQILSLFCSDAKTGLIHLSLKGGKPPYTYKLYTLDGTEIESKTADGAVEFLKGSLGQRYRIKATDACGLSWVYQDVLLQDPAVVSSTMVERKSYCLGDHVKMAARFFPNATYRWHLPDGSIREGREIEFVAGEQSAGTYKVDISLTTCTVTLYANITVRIVQITQASSATIERGACMNEAVRFAPDPATATINGKQVDQNEIEYLWERTTNPNDEESWQPMYGQTRESLEYSAQDPGVYYFRRRATIDECNSFSNYFKLTASMGIRVVMTPDEKMVTIKNKDPFTLTAGTVVSGGSPRTYQWQRSFDEKNWENVGREETYTEKKPFEITVYYRRLISSGGCTYEGDTITVRFKKRRAAYINPHLRQRTTDN